jgi:hypothetical protein
MKEKADGMGADLLLVDTGDRIEGTAVVRIVWCTSLGGLADYGQGMGCMGDPIQWGNIHQKFLNSKT